MGLFDLFKGGSKGDASRDKRDKNGASFARWAERAGDKRAQDYERQEAIRELSELATPEAVEALLRRFRFNVDPSITDQDEKDSAFRGILRAGDAAIPRVRAYAEKADSLGWPMKVLKELATPEAYAEELLAWLRRWDTDYSKFIDPKLQLLLALEEQRHPGIVAAVLPFLHDVNESARFHAVGTLLAQDDPSVIDPLASWLLEEESVRVRIRILKGIAAHNWRLPAARIDELQRVIASGIRIERDGRVIAS